MAKDRVPRPLGLNWLFKEYSQLDSGLRRDVNFNSYLELLGLQGVAYTGCNMPVVQGMRGEICSTESTRCRSRCLME